MQWLKINYFNGNTIQAEKLYKQKKKPERALDIVGKLGSAAVGEKFMATLSTISEVFKFCPS